MSLGPATEKLYRDVGDDSSAYDKALWVAVAYLLDIADGLPIANHAQNHAARALERLEHRVAEARRSMPEKQTGGES